MSAYIQRLIYGWSCQTKFVCPLQWELIPCEKTPTMVFHTGTIINNYLYVHGGSSDFHQFSYPVTLFFRFHLKNHSWENLSRIEGTPALSNHSCVVFFNRYLIIVGGWNGKFCESAIRIFDTKNLVWSDAVAVGLPDEMEGLACHTSSLLRPPKALPEILVLASNSKIRKHHTLAFRLTTSTDLSIWRFTKLPNRAYFQMDHSVVSIGKLSLHCIGGNYAKLLQKLLVYHVVQDPKNELVSALITHVADNKFNTFSNMSWSKEACRGHCTVAGKDGFLFLNGIKYRASHVDYRKNVFAYLNLGTKRGFYYVGEIMEKLAFGVCATDPATGITYYHGGLSDRHNNHSRIFQLIFFFQEARRGFMYQREVISI